ncbi:MAG: lytic transglycosylase domain-containing protein [Deltaproteobacteria bacterium]|nr:lytic transglycosylase domain-containing protein [Deltaproteobacteria bacterium]
MLCSKGARRLASLLIFSFALAGRVAHADIYTWVDDHGVLHFEDLPPEKKLDVSERFGGVEPRVVALPNGEERKYYRADVGDYDDLIRAAAEHYRLPFHYVKAVAKVESNFNPSAVSHARAKGLMQLIDSTAKLMGVKDPFDPRQNVFAGARYLRILANRFDGDLALTAAAYNAGPERVQRDGRVPDIDETTRYVARVLLMYRFYTRGQAH